MTLNSARTVRAVLAYASFLLLAGSLLAVLLVPVQDPARDVVMVLIGAIITQSKEVYGFFFGTSQSSAEKTDLLHRAIDENIGGDGPPWEMPR